MIFVLLLYALFASVFIISKIGLAHAQPLFFVGSRMFLAGLLMLTYVWFTNKEELRVKQLPIKKLILLAFFNIYLTNVCEFLGLKDLTSFKSCFFYSLSPFLSALFSFFIFSERLNYKQWTGLVLGFVGLVPILFNERQTDDSLQSILFLSWPEIYALTAVVASVYGWILLKQVVDNEKCSPFVANGCSMLIGGLMALANSAYVETWSPLPVSNLTLFIECFILLIVISNLICYNLYGFLLKRYTATFISFAGFSTPMFTALFGWFFLAETVTWHFYLAASIVCVGLILFHQEELKKGAFYTKKSIPESN